MGDSSSDDISKESDGWAQVGSEADDSLSKGYIAVTNSKNQSMSKTPQPVNALKSQTAPAQQQPPSKEQENLKPQNESQQGGGWGFGGFSWSSVGATLKQLQDDIGTDLNEISTSIQNMVVAEPSREPSDTVIAKSYVNVKDEDVQHSQDGQANKDDKSEEWQNDEAIQKMDDQVEAVVQVASKAFSSMWGGLGIVAQTVERVAVDISNEVVDTIEDGAKLAKQIKTTPAYQTATTNISSLYRGLVDTPPHPGPHAAIPKPTAPQTLTFEHCFYVYGGRAFLDELLELAESSERDVMGARGTGVGVEEGTIDDWVNGVSVWLRAVSSQQDVEVEGDESIEELIDVLMGSYGPVVSMSKSGVKGARVLSDKVVKHCPFMPTLGDGVEDGSVGDGEGAGDEDNETSGLTPPDSPLMSPMSALKRIRGEGAKKVAHVASGGVERLLAIAKSLLAEYRPDLVDELYVSWPESPPIIANIIALQKMHIVRDVQAVCDAFHTALSDSSKLLERRHKSNNCRAAAEKLCSELKDDKEQVLGMIDSACGALVYVVVQRGVEGVCSGLGQEKTVPQGAVKGRFLVGGGSSEENEEEHALGTEDDETVAIGKEDGYDVSGADDVNDKVEEVTSVTGGDPSEAGLIEGEGDEANEHIGGSVVLVDSKDV